MEGVPSVFEDFVLERSSLPITTNIHHASQRTLLRGVLLQLIVYLPLSIFCRLLPDSCLFAEQLRKLAPLV